MEKYFKKTFLTLSISYILLLLFSSILNLQKMPPLELYSLENILMIGFILMVWGCLNVNISRVKTYVFLYQLIISLSLYVFYNLYYGTGLGYNPADTYTYNKLATLGSQMNLSDYLVMLENRGYAYSDWGFMVFGKYVYSLPGNGLFNMKIINLLFH